MTYGNSKMERTASETYEPSQFLRKKAERLKVEWKIAKSDEGLRRMIKEAEEADKKEEPKTGETAAPTAVPTVGGGIVINVPIPALNVSTSNDPKWFEIVAAVRDAVLYMVAGSAGFALILKMMGVL